MKQLFFSTIFLLAVLVVMLGQLGCANIIPPSGGPRDSLPPVLVNATPKDSTINFKSNRIVLTFDEYIDLQDVQNNLLFNPLFETVPVIEARLRTITIRMRDTLQPNTTYTFNFGNAIKDINEGNPLRSFTYTFSTGPYFDSLQLSGNVVLAENGKVDSTLTIVLHSDLSDSAVMNKRPRYAARVDSAGRFSFKNLPRETYAIYAIGEAGTFRRYTSPSQYFAFADSPVVAGSAKAITLYAYKEEEASNRRAQATAGRGNTTNERRLRYTANLAGSQHDILSDLVLTTERPLRNIDSSKIRLTMDSTFSPVPNYSIVLDSTRKELRIATPWKEATRYQLILDKDFAEDTLGRKLIKSDTIPFTTRKKDDYGRIQIRVRNLQADKNPVLLFVQSDKVIFSAPVSSGTFEQALFLPGEYELRILYDRNKNGKWDAGRFFEGRIQPEFVIPIGRTITVKPAWENEFEVAL